MRPPRRCIPEPSRSKRWAFRTADEPARIWLPPTSTAARELEELRAWLAEREQTIAWFRSQAESWKQQADARSAEIAEMGRWIAEQERATRWLDGQRESWLNVAEKREETIREQQRWIRALEDGKRWLERPQKAFVVGSECNHAFSKILSCFLQ